MSLPIILCIPIVILVAGCIFFNCCYGRREIDLTRQTFLSSDGTPRPIRGTIFYNDNMYGAALFPTANGKWNATIQPSKQAMQDRIVGLQLFDFREEDVFVQAPYDVYWGFTFREWAMTLPPLLGMVGPIVVALTNDCDDIPGLTTWIEIAVSMKLSFDLYAFLHRLDSPHSSVKKKRILLFGRMIFVGVCIWGMTYTYPHLYDGLGEERARLDCEPVVYYIGFLFSTFPCLLTIGQIVVDRDKICLDEFESKEKPVEIERLSTCGCWFCEKDVVDFAEDAKSGLELSVDQQVSNMD